MAFKLTQVDSSQFRAQLFTNEEKGFTLWLVEGDDASCTLNFRTVLSVDTYEKLNKENCAIMLLRDEEGEDFNTEIGKFTTKEDAEKFLVWFKNAIISKSV
jgi:hypothetical protein